MNWANPFEFRRNYEVGDHYLYICEVEKVCGNEAEEALLAWNGCSRLRPAPPSHMAAK